MRKVRDYANENMRLAALCLVGVVVLTWLLLYRLGTLTAGLSAGELKTAVQPVGWHGIYNQPLNLPLQLLRSVIFHLAPQHGALLTRLPNAMLGGLAVICFGSLAWLWHGRRTAILVTSLFAFSAWTLHASRLASSDVQYLLAMPLLLLIQAMFSQRYNQWLVWYGSLLLWGIALYVPGLVWLVALSLWLQRDNLYKGWQKLNDSFQRGLTVLAGLIWLPLLLVDFSRSGQLALWLGFPAHWASPLKLIKQLGAVFVHLLLRGPQYPDIWLGRLPILDIFSLVMFGLGAYFYATHRQARRSRLLAYYFGAGVILVTLNGPVGLSLLVPLLYLSAAMGVAYLLHEWLEVFPANPLARGLGIGLVTLAVVVSCVYNYRSYFVAWPDNPVTTATFRYHRP